MYSLWSSIHPGRVFTHVMYSPWLCIRPVLVFALVLYSPWSCIRPGPVLTLVVCVVLCVRAAAGGAGLRHQAASIRVLTLVVSSFWSCIRPCRVLTFVVCMSEPRREERGCVVKLRHYDADAVRRYMTKQRADRRQRQLDETTARQLAADSRRDQLRQLAARQTATAATAARQAGRTDDKVGGGAGSILGCLRCFMMPELCSMFDVRCSMFDVRCSMLDARCSMLDARCSMLDARYLRCMSSLYKLTRPGAGFMNRRRLCQLTAAILTSD